jgi:hypothetical protein
LSFFSLSIILLLEFIILYTHKNILPTGGYFYSVFLKEINVFFISIAIVIGPTPPGTGVIYEAF